MTIQDIYISLNQPNLKHKTDKQLLFIHNYQYGDVVKVDGLSCFKIQRGGIITVYMSLLDRRTRTDKIYSSILILGDGVKMTEIELIRQISTCQRYQLTQLLMSRQQENQALMKKIHTIQSQLELVLKNQQKTDSELQEIKMLMKKQSPSSVKSYSQMAHYQKRAKQGLTGINESSYFSINHSRQNKLTAEWDLVVSPSSAGNVASIFGFEFKCSIGKNGATAFKKQGDGKTPVGTFPLRQIWVRTDKVSKATYDLIVQVGLPVRTINLYDGWCDEPSCELYNMHVDLRVFDNRISHENLWREDDLYDCFIVVGFNDAPVVPGRGSAIFIHVARQNYSGTAGCVAFSKPDLWKVIKYLKPYSQITVLDERKN